MYTAAAMDAKGPCSPAHHLHPPGRGRMMTHSWSRAYLELGRLMSVLGPYCKLRKVQNRNDLFCQRMAWQIHLYRRCDPHPKYSTMKTECLNTLY